MKLHIEQIKAAMQLYEIRECDIVSDEQAHKAYKLYLSLHNKPHLNKGPGIVKPIDNNKNIISLSADLFKSHERIIYLTRWVIKVLPFIDLLSEVGKLPLQRTSNDFVGYLKGIFDNYLNELKKVFSIIPDTENLIKDSDLLNVQELCEKILVSIQEYYKGFPNIAFSTLKGAIVDNLEETGYLNYFLIFTNQLRGTLYKMRVGTNHTYSSEEMFHIPFELRGLVSTNRYSIPGLPCVYLGSTPLTCWEELNKPDLNTIQTSLFLLEKDISYLDLSTPPVEAIERFISNYQHFSNSDMNKIYEEMTSYLVFWPLIAACSIRVKNTNDSFKPEYIISQLLLQWIRQSDYDGICYFSTKVKDYSKHSAPLYRNYAFPVQQQSTKGHCSILREKFHITNAVPWQMFQLYKDSHLCVPNEGGIQVEIEFIDGMSLLYSSTDFNKLENFLHNKFTIEKSI
ncbi:hypothetical protein V7183_22165 [Bacillus sp. JJ1127]|uniref:hypothetical protein n=1 Tax=Bacillus sp. JJ1127 TaxID=3122952 RepID=UPI002FFEF504